MSNNHNFLALDWVKSEIEETLKQAQQALEAHISNPSDESQLRFCLAYLHQIFGTLQMVEFHGAAMLAEEMEKLCLSLVNGKVADSRKAYDVLVKAMLHLPAYLERLQATKRDVPFVLLPIINTLRIAHDEIPLSEVSLFQPDFSRVYSIIGQEGETPSVEALKKLRLLYQSGLVAVMRDADPHAGIVQLRQSVQLLSRMLSSKPLKSLWAVSDALLEGLDAKSVPLSPAVKLLLGEIEREIRKFAAFPQHVPAEELLKNILYYIAKSQGRTAAIAETKALYRLDEALPTAEKIEADAQSLNAPDRSALKSVVKSTADELSTIKETIDDLMYADRPEIRTLEPLLPALKQIAGTLTVMDWSDLQRIADEIHGVLSAAIRSGHLSEGTLLHVAAGILELEGGLQQLIDDQPLFESYAPSTTVADQLSAAQSAVLRESRTALEKAKEAIVEYISSQWDPERLAELPELINTVRGGLTMLDIVRPAQILSRLSEYIEKQLLTENYRPSWSEMDTMADVVSSVEYYLERVASHHQNNDLLELAERALQRLGFGLVLVMPETDPEELERAREQQAQRAQEVEKGPEEPHEIGDENTTLLNMPAVEINEIAVKDHEPDVESEPLNVETVEPASASDALEVTGIHAVAAPIAAAAEDDTDRTLISMPALQIDILDESAPTATVSAALSDEGFDTDKTLIAMPALQIEMPGESESLVSVETAAEDDMGKTLVSMPALRLPDDMILTDKTHELPAVTVGQASNPMEDLDSDKTLISMPALVLPEDKSSTSFGASQDFDSTLTFDAETLLDGVEFLGAKKAAPIPTEAVIAEAPLAEQTIVSESVSVADEEAVDAEVGDEILTEEETFDAEATMASSAEADDATVANVEGLELTAAPVVVAETPAQTPKRAPLPLFAAMPTDDFDQDDEIREIFIEEVEEVLETIHEYFPKWAANYENKAALTEFRRGFHTLKGSGRMVGARVVGELAWSIENMLNRVIDQTARATPVMCRLIESVIQEVPGLVGNFRDKELPAIHTVPLMEVADQFAKGLSPTQEDVEQAVAYAHGEFGAEAEESGTEEPVTGESLATQEIETSKAETIVPEEPVEMAATSPESLDHVEVVEEEADVAAISEATAHVDDIVAEVSSAEGDTSAQEDLTTTQTAPVLYVIPEDDFSQDDEIREIFIEEAEEVLETIHEYFPKWAANYENKAALTEFRRGFHTLKGSGRMVGAKVVGETAWAIENMLNRVIDHTARPSPAMSLLITSVLEMVPDLVRNFSQKEAPVYNPGYLMAVADEFSRGHAVPEEQVERAVIFAKDPSLADRIAAEQMHAETVSEASAKPELAVAPDAATPVGAAEADVAESAEQEDLTDAFEALASSLEEIEPEAATGVDDPVLMDIFTSEANAYLEEIDRFLEEHAGAGSVAVTDAVLRALHTLRGSAGMAGVRLVASVAAPMETLFKDMRNQGRLLNANHLALLRETHRIIKQSITSLMQGGDGSADGEEALLDRIDSVAKMPVDHTEVTEAPAVLNTAGLVAGFLDLGIDELMDAPWELSNWLSAEDRADHIETLKQELGKLVPAARESGIDPLSAVASALAAIYTQILADDALLQNDAMLEVLGDAHDEIINIFDTLAACQTVAPNPRLIERLQQWYAPVNAIPAAAAPAVVEYDDGADPELLAIFLEEGEEILEAADTEFRNWQAKPDDKNALRALQRHLHTLKGGARMAVVASLGDLAHELEFLYEGLVDGRYTASPVLTDLLQRCHDRLADMLTGLMKNGRCTYARDLVEAISLYRHSPKDSVILDFFSSAAAGSTKAAVSPAPVVAPAAALPEPLPIVAAPVAQPAAAEIVGASSEATSGFDPEMLEIFLEEAQEIVEETTRMLEEWMADPEVLEPVRILQRGLHTLKGGARMAGVTALGDIAHEMENLYEAAGLGRLKITASGLSLLQRCHDSIAVAVEDLQEKGECPGFSDLVDALKRYLVNPAGYEDVVRAAAPKAAAAAPSAPAPVQAPSAAPALNLTPVDLSGIPSMMGNFRKAESAQQAAQEMIRVSSELMEKLINLAGESSIIRSRVEMGVHGFAQTVEEMGATVQRLADQLRRMQGELEAQIIAQHTDDSTKYADFDPLEMDQYSSVNQLSKSLYESASDLMDIKVTLIEKARDTETLLLQQSRLNTELQEGLMSSRMVPFSRLVPRLQRIVRQTSQELHKPAELHVINAEGEMDRTLLERLVAPLEHMLRNAVDHGLENPEERAAAGKESMGRVSLSISREGGEVVLHLTDDGKGINVDAVRKKALERGLIEEGQTISDRELLQFIFHAGFSTAQKVTQISGRGVGMDVVQSEIKQLGGVVSIQSERGKGTTFVLRLPFTVAVSRALMVRIGEDVYAIPLSQIEGIVRASPYELETYYSPDAPPFVYAGLSYKLHYLGEFVHGVRTPSLFGQTLPLPILLVRGGDQRVSIQVDQLIGSREIVVKSVGAQLASVAGISGATILGDGSVVIILDVVAMLRAAAIQRPRLKTAEKGPETAPVPEKATKTVMVVDDSVTVRKVTSRLLERHGYDVVLAKDGLDAISKLEEIRPDIMLLDIEMPRMDGFEVASLVRHNPNLTGLPIIMITSRTGEKHRERAFQIGVNCYMGKPFQEQQLLDTIGELLAAPVAR